GPAAVAGPVEREAYVVVAALHVLAQPVDVRRADAVVDVPPVGLGRDRSDGRAEAAEYLGRHAVRGPVRAVEQHVRAGEVELLEARLELAEVVTRGSVQLADAAGRGRRLGSLEDALDLGLLLVRELRALGAEELDAV